jgi:uncharacterized protein with beta-barrel porin domain
MDGAKGATAQAPANTARVEVGRLLEVVADAGYRVPAEVDEVFTAIDAQVASLVSRGVPYITVADWRRCPIMPPAAAARLKDLMAERNARVLCSAGLVSTQSAAAVLQFARVTREAGLEDRRVFEDPNDVARWLSAILTTAESERLAKFLGIGPPSSGSSR